MSNQSKRIEHLEKTLTEIRDAWQHQLDGIAALTFKTDVEKTRLRAVEEMQKRVDWINEALE